MKVALYCTCGAAWKASADPKTIDRLVHVWRLQHSGPGHELTDARTAARARARATSGQAVEVES